MSNDFYDLGGKYGEGIQLDFYNGRYALVAARKKDDQIYKEWCYPQKRDGSKEPNEKSLPWKIDLGGNAKDAIDALRFFAMEIKDHAKGQGSE